MFALLVLLLLAATEAALRFPRVRSALPARTHYYHPAITTRLDAIERTLRDERRVDVLFIGSSIVLTNLHPQVFDEVVGPGEGSIAFNAGLPGLWPTSVQLYAEHVWLPLAHPRVVVQGIRYPELAARTHAKHESQVWSGKIERSWRDSDLFTRLRATFASNVYLLQYRGTSVGVLEQYRDGRTDNVGWRNAYETRGQQPISDARAIPVDEWEADLPNEGVCERPRCEVGFTALRRTIAAVRAAGSDYVLLNVPEHASRWRSSGGLTRYQHYLARLRAFADAEGVDFIDPTGGDPFRFERTPYADLAHMTEAGSRQFTRAVAEQMSPFLGPLRAERPHGQRPEGQTPVVAGLNVGQRSVR